MKQGTSSVSQAANQHIWVISEGSCDTEGWSNAADCYERDKLPFFNSIK